MLKNIPDNSVVIRVFDDEVYGEEFTIITKDLIAIYGEISKDWSTQVNNVSLINNLREYIQGLLEGYAYNWYGKYSVRLYSKQSNDQKYKLTYTYIINDRFIENGDELDAIADKIYKIINKILNEEG